MAKSVCHTLEWISKGREGRGREIERQRQRDRVLEIQYFIEKLRIMKFSVWENLEKGQKEIFTDTNLHTQITYTYIYKAIARKCIFSVRF